MPPRTATAPTSTDDRSPHGKGTTIHLPHALLLMDLQGNHLARMPGDYLPRAVHALGVARAADVPVVHVILQLRDGHIDAHPRNRTFGSLPSHLYTADDPGAAIHPDVATVDGEIVVHKNGSVRSPATTSSRSWPSRT